MEAGNLKLVRNVNFTESLSICEDQFDTSAVTLSITGNLAINIFIWIVCLILFSISPKIIKDFRQKRRMVMQCFSTNFYSDLHQPSATASFPEKLQQTDEFTSWFRVFMRLSDKDIADRCGSDAVSYLRFQRYLIGYNLFILIVTVVIILPVNYIGKTFDPSEIIGRTAIINVHVNLLWLHVTTSLLYLLGMIFLIFRISRHLSLTSHTSDALLISNIPWIENCQTLIKNHLNQAFPNVEIRKISSIFDTRKLLKLNKALQVAHVVQNTCNLLELDETDQLPCTRSNIFYISAKEKEVIGDIEIEKEKFKNKPLGIVIVELTSKEDAQFIYSSFHTYFKCSRIIIPSEWSHVLKVKQWRVGYAPLQDDIIWENLPASPFSRFIRLVFVTIVLFFVSLIFTSPALIISIYKEAGFTTLLLLSFFPSFLLNMLVKLLPIIVVFSVSFLKSWTKSSEQSKTMKALFVTLLFTILLLPSLGLTAFDILTNFLNIRRRIPCIFSLVKNIFFVNYVIVSALTSTGLEFLRISELLRYIWRYITVRSAVKRKILRCYDSSEFEFGEHYARVLALFSVVITYSILFPIISVFGCLYIVLKHFVDRYNLYFIYRKSSVHKGIHVLAAHLIIFTSILPQVCLLEYTLLVTAERNAVSQVYYYSLGILVASLTLSLSFIMCLYVKRKRLSALLEKIGFKKPKVEVTTT